MARTALVLEMDAGDADRLSDRLVELGADSVLAEDAAAGTPHEQPVFDERGEDPALWPRLRVRVVAADEAAARGLLERACEDLGIAVPPFTVERVEERDWVRESQSQFDPIRISDRMWVVPSWHAPSRAEAINLLLDPGLAFGTGSHPTTRLCLRWLEEVVKGGETVLDYGCGSGILAIASMKLGARRAIGVDIDADALESARANALTNGVECEFVGADVPLALEADLVVANILANPLKVLAPVLAGLTRRHGRLAIAGLLAHQADELAACYAAWFDVEGFAEEEGWTRISMVRRP